MFSLQAVRHLPSLIERNGSTVNFAGKIVLTSRQQLASCYRGQPVHKSLLSRRITTLANETASQGHKQSEEQNEKTSRNVFKAVGLLGGLGGLLIFTNSSLKQIRQLNDFFNLVNYFKEKRKEFIDQYAFYKSNDKETQNHSLAKKMAKDIENLRDAIKDEQFKNNIKNLIEITTEDAKKKINNERKKQEELSEELKTQHCNEMTQMKSKHDQEIKELKENLDNEKKKLEIEKKNNATSALEAKNEYDEQIKLLNVKIEDLQGIQKNGEVEQKRLQRILDLFKQCPKKQDAGCSRDLNNYFYEIGLLEFPLKHSFSPKFMGLLEQALQHNLHTEVDELSFRGTHLLSNDGLEHLMEGLKTNTTIKKLDLGSTNIGYNDHSRKDVKSIAKMLKKNRTLKELNLYYSNLNDNDVDILIDAIKENKILHKLDLSLTRVSQGKKDELKKLNIDVV